MKKILLMLLMAACVPLTAQTIATDSIGKCNGVFSVSPTTKVRFSQGNLQYQPSTRLWRFADVQTDVLGWQDYFASPRYKGWIDLFGWGTGDNPTGFST